MECVINYICIGHPLNKLLSINYIIVITNDFVLPEPFEDSYEDHSLFYGIK